MTEYGGVFQVKVDAFSSFKGDEFTEAVLGCFGAIKTAPEDKRKAWQLIGTHAAEAVPFFQPDFVLWTNGEWSTC